MLSADCSTSNSPEFRPSPHDEIHVGPRCRQEPTITDTIHKKAKSNAGIEHDFSKTFNAGESLAHLDPSVTTWQDLQNLTQTTPTAPPPDKPRKKKKKRKSAGDEGDGTCSSNGSDLVSNGRRDGLMTDRYNQDHLQENSELSPSRERKQKPKLRKVEGGLPTVKGGVRRPGPLGPEGQRPSIERGGTNMIKMEVNGIKSPPPTAEQQEHTSPVTREVHVRKQRKPEPDFMLKEPLGQSKPPLPRTTATFPGDGLDHSDGGLPEVPHPWKKHSKYAVTRSVKDETSMGHWQNSGDGLREGGGVGRGNQSPDGSEMQPFSNADRGLRECLEHLENSDWNTKCDGLTAVRRLAKFHPEKLFSELHTVTLAVIEEVKI